MGSDALTEGKLEQVKGVSLCQLSLPDTTFEQDVEVARAVGAGGLGVFEDKLPDDESDATRALADAALHATVCSPSVVTILPQVEFSRFGGPSDVDERVREMAKGIRRLGTIGADTVLAVTGPAGKLGEAEARQQVIDALRSLASEASSVGTRLAIEPMRPGARGNWTLVSSLEETLGLLDDVRADVGIVFDTWHLWDSPDLWGMLPKAIDRIYGVQVADYRTPSARDRVVAGDGIGHIDQLLGGLDALGYDGWYDMEVFSDDGRFGEEVPDSLWKLEPEEFARRQVDGFNRCWDARSNPLEGR